MVKVNLRELYPDYYKEDYVIEVPENVAAVILEYERMEAAYRRRVYYHHAQYSLDRSDGIEHSPMVPVPMPHEIFEREVMALALYRALSVLPEKQARRIYGRFFLDLSIEAIASSEGVSAASVSESIRRGLRNLGKNLKKFL